ncbi:bifunctional 3-(3-hydroxy-phenyl)propionate/3-hydroxycinnamic acid hydroxylase [Alcanivorax sp.]|jgi:3-(3-hydroxy-phenyl)propionate hydroxylase|uniref:bifunctional 3-(3-hydroxy-phenyl)propionate/3-hydroxycinnamic acid hydroxylase n=1 Tax=Alcanivorax sp. TaxID=1872427 RepID=UPI0032D92F42
MNNNESIELLATTDVLVVGYGPVGAALTAALGRFGVNALAIDKVEEVLLMPRAIALDNEALRILQMFGLGEDAFDRIAIPEVKMRCPYTGDFGKVNSGGSIDGHPKLVTFYQPDLEAALRKEAGKHTSVSFRSGLQLLDLEEVSDGVVATVETEDGTQGLIKACYLVGADGSGSKARTLIGQDFKGQSYAEDWLIVDAGGRERKAIDHIEFICDPKRPTPHMPAPGGRERWEFMLLPGETREEMEKPETVARLLSPWIPPEELNIERKAVYRFHARCCDSFQKGRVFLVGDAAHITPPFAGQGLVAGLRDAANLGWKLAWVVDGKATPALLDSYDQERRPHAQEMIDLAKFMGRLVIPRNALSAIAIHGAMRLIGLIPPVRKYLEELEIKPDNSFKAGCFIAGKKKPLARGGQLPQALVKIPDGIILSDDSLSGRLTLVGFGVDPASHLSREAKEAWAAVGGAFLQIGVRGQKAQPGSAADFIESFDDVLVPGIPSGHAAIVRPDMVVMHNGPATEAQAMLDDCLKLMKV